MTDTLTKPERSARMALVRAKDTGPERWVHAVLKGLRFKPNTHSAGLPGTPDFVFPRRKAVLFVHGCFWHRHEGCKLARLPKSRLEFWLPKLEANRKRDQRARRALTRLGWRSMVIWECQVGREEIAKRRIKAFLSGVGGAK